MKALELSGGLWFYSSMNDSEHRTGGPVARISLEQVNGLNVAEGLERCGNDRQLYWRVLLDFRDGYSDAVTRLDALLRAGKWSEAKALAHAVKGTSGMLSANDLFAASSSLEAIFKRAGDSGVPPSHMQDELDRFRRELVRLMAGLDKLSDPPTQAKKK